MAKSRISILAAILKGLLAAIALTLVCMVIFAALVVFLHISDTLLTILNQILKVAAIFLGVRFAVGRGGDHRHAVHGSGLCALCIPGRQRLLGARNVG